MKAERWTATQAGAHCRTARSPNGITGHAYRYYVRRLGAPDTVGRDTETGAKLYDPNAVMAWHAKRVGQGRRTDLKKRGQR